MREVFFRYNEHPGDLLRDTSITVLPDPNHNLEDFLVQFLRHYQSDERVAFLNDLYKVIEGELCSDEEEFNNLSIEGYSSDKEVKEEILVIENELKQEAYKNFYHLVFSRKIELIDNG